jgi:hypothetical protein
MAQARGKLIPEAVPRSTCTSASRIAALYHKISDHPVEDRIIIETLPGKEHEIVNRRRYFICVERDGDIANIGMEDCRVYFL